MRTREVVGGMRFGRLAEKSTNETTESLIRENKLDKCGGECVQVKRKIGIVWLNTGVSVREAYVDTVIALLQGFGIQRLLVPSDVPLVAGGLSCLQRRYCIEQKTTFLLLSFQDGVLLRRSDEMIASTNVHVVFGAAV